MSFDNVLKFMVKSAPQAFVDWLLPESGDNSWELLDTELALEPIRADTVFFLQGQGRILHLEFQTEAQSKPAMPLRMLDYWVRLHRQYACEVEQVVIYLRRTQSPLVFKDYFHKGETFHRYRVIRLWEVEPSILLDKPFLLPFAVLAKTEAPESLLARVARQVDIIEDRAEQIEVSACAQLLAGISFSKALINMYLREELMRESVVYQSIVEESTRKGLGQGLQQGESLIILRILTKRFGSLPERVKEEVSVLGTECLEELGEALLDFKSLGDLDDWLAGR
ncbi:MAG: Rpn family recombination-promoting nuclease/putative transposase [Cyanobacteriota bacterium]|jgi:predicted transposase/invertase (TIGR01784 family)